MKTILANFLLLLFTAPVFALIGSNVVLDVRTGGSNTNGGGFDPLDASGGNACGTDYSQQDSPQVVYTDLVIGATTTQLTSSGHPFTSAAICNLVNITSGTGFTAGWYEIVNVVGGVATMDRSVGTTLSTGGHGNEGGGFQTIAQAQSFQSTYNGSQIYLQSGTYTLTAYLSVSSQAIVGYHTVHGDITSVCAVSGTCPLITTATNSTILIKMDAANGVLVLSNLNLTNTAGTRASGIMCSASCFGIFDNLVLSGFTIGIDGDTSAQWKSLVVHQIDISGTTISAILNDAPMTIDDCYIHGNSTTGANGAIQQNTSTTLTSITRCLIVNNTGNGVSLPANGVISMVNDVVAGNSGDGVYSGTGDNVFAENSIFYNNGGYGIHGSGIQGSCTIYNNAFGSNTAGSYICSGEAIYGGVFNNIGLTADPFVNDAGGNYALNSTAGGGAALKAAGVPGVFPGGLTTGYPDIGAAQSNGGSGNTTQPYGYAK
jgi:hypothetical protein